MSVVWAICGAGRGVGKTTLAFKLCALLPKSVYAKCGHGVPQEGKPANFFNTTAALDEFVQSASGTAEHIVVESNAWVLGGNANIAIFIDGSPERGRLRHDAESLRRAAHLHVSAGATRAQWLSTLEKLLPDERLAEPVCDLLSDQRNYLARMQPEVRTKVWLESAGMRVFGNGLARLLKNVETMGTLGGAAGETGLS